MQLSTFVHQPFIRHLFNSHSQRLGHVRCGPFILSCNPQSRACAVPRDTPRHSATLTNSSILKIESVLRHKFHDRALLAQAVTHRSLVNQRTGRFLAFYEQSTGDLTQVNQHNERLECVGDRVFGLLTVQNLYEADDFASESTMSIDYHSLVSRKQADEFCRALGLDRFLLATGDLHGKPGSRYGDMFEAILGALFIDGGFEAAHRFFQSSVVPLWRTPGRLISRCSKMELQEYLVNNGLPGTALGSRMKYTSVCRDFKNQKFTQAIEIFGTTLSTATEGSRSAADQAAAAKLLAILKKTKTTCLLIRLARRANDAHSLKILQAVRAEQVTADQNERGCTDASDGLRKTPA